MPGMTIHLEGDGVWPEMAKKTILHVQDFDVAALDGGMQSGAPSIAIKIDLPTGQVVFAETSLKLFLTAADAFKARYGDPRR
jgi:hypothetical protein